jgi:serine/threonine protein phosphatase 1
MQIADPGAVASHYHRAMNLLSTPVVHYHAANRTGRDFVVGDLHGCVDALGYLLVKIGLDPTRDRLFSVGDLVDRGRQSEAALALLDKPWFYAVLGNHEDMLCAVAEGELRRQWWYGIGGSWAAALTDAALEQYANRLRTLPLVRVVGSGSERFNVLHAEFFGSDADLDAGDLPDEQLQQILWGRELATANGRAGGPGNVARQRGLSPTYCGHTPVRDVQQIGAQVFIDTGAFAPGGKLTVVEALTSHRWSVTVETAREEGAAQMALP